MANNLSKFILTLLMASAFLASLKSQNGLVGYFPLDADAQDYSTTNIDGVLNNTVPTAGILDSAGTALSFNGIDAYVFLSTANRTIRDTVSISAWIKTTSLENGFIVCKYDYNLDQGFHFGINEGFLKLGGRNNSGEYTNTGNSTLPINDGLWHHVVAKIHGNTWEIWIDCQQDVVVTSNASNPSLVSTEPFTIGNFALENNKFFAGAIDEVRIYNTNISPAQISDLCQEQIVTSTRPIIAQQKEVNIYPNPSSEMLHFSTPNSSVASIVLFNARGQIVARDKIYQQQFNIANFPAGIYYLSLFDAQNGLITSRKIMVL